MGDCGHYRSRHRFNPDLLSLIFYGRGIMNTVQMQIQISEEVRDALKAAAEQKGITPNILARMILYDRFGQADGESKTDTFGQITLPEELLKRIREYIEKEEPYRTVEAFIEATVDYRIENYPWFTGDICVHNEECMHWKSVEEWREEGEKP
jgi:hypothetical protein